ncbi:MAG: hypothetical protein LAQ69_31625 [Acidobacteriia bacterium]|nr:hypothetical protein [Terriglobia bacterium]
MKKNLINAGLFAVLVVVSQFSLLKAAGLSGAIFTTVADGTIVNANTQYTSKCAVYLDGGPGANAPAKAAGLPSGDYFFQVTDPSGQTLLSTDMVNNRRFHVSTDGVITAYTGIGGPVHPTGIDQVHPELGSITIGLAYTTCPTEQGPAGYLDTPNNGGVYKVWVTAVANYIGNPAMVDNPCGNGCSHGFASSTSKTDNFKVKPNIPTFCLSVAKQIVVIGGDGSQTISRGFNWPISLMDSVSLVTNNFFTNKKDGTLSVCGLVAGTYTVTESLSVDNVTYQVIGLTVNGAILPADSVYSFTWTAGQPDVSVVFQNQVQPPTPPVG